MPCVIVRDLARMTSKTCFKTSTEGSANIVRVCVSLFLLLGFGSAGIRCINVFFDDTLGYIILGSVLLLVG